MERVRQEIDRVDEQLISLLSRRFALSKEMGKLKSKLGTGIRDESRELKVWERWLSLSKSHPVPEQFLQILFVRAYVFFKSYPGFHCISEKKGCDCRIWGNG